MTPRFGATLLKVVLVCVAAALGFAVFHDSMRALETRASLALLNLFGADNVRGVDATSVLVISGKHPAFHVLITPSCSSLASLLAFGCLGPLAPRGSGGRRALAVGSAASVIAAGNVMRIAASIAVGLVAGRSSLVLFHDWVGSMFTFVYTVGGYILMLALLLPKGRARHPSPLPSAMSVETLPGSGRRPGLSVPAWPRLALVSLAVMALVGFAPPAQAADDYPYTDADPGEVDRWGFLYRHCTSFVAWRMNQHGAFHTDMHGPNGAQGHWGNAHAWADNAERIGFRVDATPAPGAIAHWRAGEDGAGEWGHVAVVNRVTADGSVVIEEYNGATTYGYSRAGPLRAPRYIHVYDDASLTPVASSPDEPSRDGAAPEGYMTNPKPDLRLVSGRTIDVAGEFTDVSGVSLVTFFVTDNTYRWTAIGSDSRGGDGTYSVPWRVDYPAGATLHFMAEAVDRSGNHDIDSVRGLEVVEVVGSSDARPRVFARERPVQQETRMLAAVGPLAVAAAAGFPRRRRVR